MRRALPGVLALLLALFARTGDAVAMRIESVTSPGGITAWLVEDHSLPIIALAFSFRGGSAADRPEQAGLSQLAVGLLDEGAGPLDSAAFSRALADSATSLSLRASLDRISGSIRTLTRHETDAFELLRLALTEPRIDADPFQRVRGDMVQAAERGRRSPGPLAACVWWHDGFPGDGYGNPPGGRTATLQALTAADVRTLLGQRLARDTLVVGVEGDIDPARLGPALDRIFGALPAKAGLPAPPPVDLADRGAVRIVAAAVPQSTVTFGAPGLMRGDPDWYAAALALSAFGGDGLTSRLAVALRQERGLVYSVSLGPLAMMRTGLLLGAAATRNDKAGETVETIRAAWTRFREEGPSEAELADAKARIAKGYPLSLDSSRSIAGTLTQLQEDRLGIDYLDRREALFDRVTLADARRVARRLFDPATLRFTVAGMPQGLEAASEGRCE